MRNGATTLFTTHDVEEAILLADRVIKPLCTEPTTIP
jgi:ABC-type nitrate/sulfonate/bicarbonate transport system ATPase subunit